MQCILVLLLIVSDIQSPDGTNLDSEMWDGPRLWAIQLPEHLEGDEDAQFLLEHWRELAIHRYEAYGKTSQQGGLPPRGAQGIPISNDALRRILSIGRNELEKRDVDFKKLNLVLNCLLNRPVDGAIVTFLKEVMLTSYVNVESLGMTGSPPEQVATINTTLQIMAQQYTRETRTILFDLATILVKVENCEYFCTQDGEFLSELRRALIVRNAILAYITYAPAKDVLPFVRKVKVAYEKAGVELQGFDSLMYLAVELTKGNDLRRQPSPVP